MEERNVEDVLAKMKTGNGVSNAEDVPKKRKNSRRKGCTFERELCRILTERFSLPFARCPQSGAWGTVANVDARAREVLTADIICPEGFKWSIEAKAGYDVDLWSLFGSPNDKGVFRGRKGDIDTLESFWTQARWQAERTSKRPVVVYRKDGRPAACIVDAVDLETMVHDSNRPIVAWNNRIILSLADWLAMPHGFFFV